jgi:hypothetical protein
MPYPAVGEIGDPVELVGILREDIAEQRAFEGCKYPAAGKSKMEQDEIAEAQKAARRWIDSGVVKLAA